MPELKYRQAINQALAEEMERDERVVIFGEDVAEAGGPFVATKGLLERFGRRRVRDTPISEALLAGLAAGAAMTGLRPVVEIMFADFTTLVADQLVNHAAKVSALSGGTLSAPMVVRTLFGGGARNGPQHSQALEGWLAHVPGLKVVTPATPADAKGLLKAAIRDPDPVVFVESLRLWTTVGEVPDDRDAIVPIGEASVARPGEDVTIVAWGAAVPRALEAAERLDTGHGLSAEVLDLRTLAPLDRDALLGSVARTGRLLVVHDAVETYGPGAEIAAIAAGAAFDALKAPVGRVAAPNAAVPIHPDLERAYYPSTDGITAAVLDMVGVAA